ncbi:MAG: 50S ribosomal protein L1 [Candidatus Omnitrophica bacterium]|nr:50S ribosomal protein L1 [Candidatus Omnitrophota bacterium]
MASKRYKKAAELVERGKAYTLQEAVQLLKQMPATKFDESVELSASLNIDPKKTDQVIRGTLTLPHGTGKTRKVLVFCKGEQELRAKQAGADFIGGADLIQKIQDGWLEFDVAIATPEMMRDVSKLGKVLGPRGLMPNPRAGTVTDDVAKAIQEVKRGRIEFKMDKLANLHVVIGRLSFQAPQLADNASAAMQAIARSRPASLKGDMLRRMALNSTMSPGIPLDIEGLETETAAAG